MKKVQGEFGQAYNFRNERSGAFWSDRFHCTLVDQGTHLLNCLKYIDLNMVRAGVVQHPRDWPWCGFQEIFGEGKSLQLIKIERLCELTGQESPEVLRQRYREMIEESLKREKQIRDAKWTESVAVGPRGFVDEIQNQVQWRTQWVREEDPLLPGQWSIGEPSAEYGVEVDLDNDQSD
jgi:putative transposase